MENDRHGGKDGNVDKREGGQSRKKSFHVRVTAEAPFLPRGASKTTTTTTTHLVVVASRKREGRSLARLGENAISRPGPNVAARQTFISRGADCPD